MAGDADGLPLRTGRMPRKRLMIPFIPLLALIGIIGSGGAMIWYYQLSEEDKRKADKIAAGYATTLFGKAVHQLNDAQARRVHGLTKRHFD